MPEAAPPPAAERWLRPRVLLADRDVAEAARLQRLLESHGYEIQTARTNEQAFNILDEQAVEALVAEVRGSGLDGIRLMQVARRRDPEVCVVLIAGAGEVEVATLALGEGAHDFQTRPVNAEKVLATLRRGARLRRLISEIFELNQRLDKKYGLSNIVGHSTAMAAVLNRILQVGPTDATVLITGETGTGKELVGSALHQNSTRRGSPLIKLHCGDLAEGLVESELFGHERGAFTGAVASRKGRFELADGGTLFLDEVSELPSGTQVKLLRVLQEREIQRLGGERTIPVDVRLIAATSRDLRALVESGQFREDLFYRLHVVAIEMPALRHRPQDIPLLAEHFLRESAAAYGRRIPGFTSRAMNRLTRYAWPGNVRELKNFVTTMVINSEGGRSIDVADLPQVIQEIPESGQNIFIPIGTSWEEAERRLIEQTLTSNHGDIVMTSKVLKMSLRTLYRRLSQYRTG